MKDIAYKLLWSTIESDVGMHEILWEVNTLLPENTSDQNLEIAKNIIGYFLEHGLATLHFSVWRKQDREKIDSEKTSELLNKNTSWDPPSIGENYIMISNTEKGKHVYDQKFLPNYMV